MQHGKFPESSKKEKNVRREKFFTLWANISNNFQLVEQWTGNPEAGGSSLFLTINFQMLTEFIPISLNKPDVRKILKN